MSWESIDIRCTNGECLFLWPALVKRTERDNIFSCPDCNSPSQRTISAPLVLKESYHMGHKRGGDYQLLKEASRLNKAAVNRPPSERGDLQRGIQELKRAAHNETSKKST